MFQLEQDSPNVNPVLGIASGARASAGTDAGAIVWVDGYKQNVKSLKIKLNYSIGCTYCQ